ncbi:MAG: ABC transporter ATP-binding protein [Deltaproteobacteria bacterium]|nr:ABC transporter ATP-binding protein [Deltaproteobacteria bacterium]
MEEGKLGKPYNIRLFKRLARYAIPYKMIIGISLFIIIFITIFDLTLPYLSKVAIDKYILSSWYKVDLLKISGKDLHEFMGGYGELIKKSEDGLSAFISHTDMKKIDPIILNEYKKRGFIQGEQFYRAKSGCGLPFDINEKGEGFIRMPDNTLFISEEKTGTFSKADILKIRENDIRGLAFLGMAILGLIILSFAANYYEYYLLEIFGQNVMHDIRMELFRKMQSRSVGFFDRHPVGILVTRVTNDIENLNEMFKSVIVTVFKDVFILVGILGVLLYLNWRLALVSFLIIPFIFGFTMLFSSMAREAFREMRAKIAKLNGFLQEKFSGMRIIQLYAREVFQMRRFEEINHENYLAGMKQIRIFAIFMPVMELFSSFTVALIIWYGGKEVIGDQLSLGSLVAFISYIQMFFKPIRDISEKYNIMQLAMASTERIIEFMDNKEEIADPEISETPESSEGHVKFENVSFSYKMGQPVLKDINFEIRPGETVAVVGATGAGKTTLVNLIERFYDIDEGMILLDNVDIRKYQKSGLRSRIGLVMQDVFIFSASVAENIHLGNGVSDVKAVIAAAEKANAYPFIQMLPDQLDHELSEGGSTLSGGERQLLSFARALYYRPKLLILDEATSSVDPETEQLIQDAISKMTTRQTTLVVAHRLSTIRKADRIIVMHHGRIMEQGNHKELIARKGLYYKLNRFREYNTR